jgi:hypothetical protein
MKSFILSFTILLSICFFFMSVFDKKANAFYNKSPEWVFIILMILCMTGLLLSLYWGIAGMIKGQRLLNGLGIFCSIFGIGIFVLGYVMEKGKGKESPGQFDHELSLIKTRQRVTLYDLMKKTNTDTADVELVPYWKMSHHPGKFVVCIQKGNVIALQIKNKPLHDISDLNALDKLNWLILQNCGLQSISALNLPLLQRLSVNNNQLTNLSGIEHSPQLKWLEYMNNPIQDSTAAKIIVGKIYANL